MTPTFVGILGIGFLFVFFALGMPIGFVMALVGFAGYAYLVGLHGALTNLGLAFYSTATTYTLSVIPLFVLMGQFAAYSGLSRDIYYTIYKWIGHLRGGLAIATIGGCAGFAAISGSSLATAATMGTVALPEMKRYRYDTGLATGTVAAGGTLGILIPPSVTFIVYAMLAEQSVGKLFIAGILPGLLLAGLFSLVIYVQSCISPQFGPPGPKSTLNERINALKGIWGVAVLFVVVMGGIYAGVFTPTEAGGVGAFGAFIFALFKKQLTRESLANSLVEAGRITAMIFVIIIGAYIFGYFLSVTRIPSELAEFVSGLQVSRYLVMLVLVVLYIILGMFMEGFAILVLTIPVIFPLITSLGFDAIWFGVIIVILMEMAMITPPVGINVFVIKGIAEDVPMYTIFRGIVPFWLSMAVCIFILTVFPSIALFLPNFVRG